MCRPCWDSSRGCRLCRRRHVGHGWHRGSTSSTNATAVWGWPGAPRLLVRPKEPAPVGRPPQLGDSVRLAGPDDQRRSGAAAPVDGPAGLRPPHLLARGHGNLREGLVAQLAIVQPPVADDKGHPPKAYDPLKHHALPEAIAVAGKQHRILSLALQADGTPCPKVGDLILRRLKQAVYLLVLQAPATLRTPPQQGWQEPHVASSALHTPRTVATAARAVPRELRL
mmetsp:Transcript_79437/g.219705  ORF Transcript_79437/g.219705 Transcript_79437/m.219705 type:complete len:225 (+) Transcript_79437:573-1247(+)